MKKILPLLLIFSLFLIFIVGCPSTPTPSEKFTLDISTIGQGSVTKDPNNATYTKNQSVELTAHPDTGWKFSQWQGDASGNDNPKTITMNSNKNITAVFTQIIPDNYTLTVSASPSNGGLVSKYPDQQSYIENESITINATPNIGWIFINWFKGNSLYETLSSTTFNIKENMNLIAFFEEQPLAEYNLTVSASPNEGGQVNKIPNKTSYTENENVTITATPNEGWNFINWRKGGQIFETEQSSTFNINENLDLTAVFNEQDITIEIGWVNQPTTLIAGSNNYTFSWNATVTEITKGETEYICTLDGNEVTQSLTEFTANDLIVGTHTFSVKAVNGSSESETLNTEIEYLGDNVSFDVNGGNFYVSLTEEATPIEDAELEIIDGKFDVSGDRFEATITCSVILLDPEALIKIAKILIAATLDNFFFPKKSVDNSTSGDYFKFYLSKIDQDYKPSEIKIYARGSLTDNNMSFNGPGQLSYDPNHPEAVTDAGTMTAQSQVYIDESREINLVGEPKFTLNTEGWSPTITIKQANDFDFSQE